MENLILSETLASFIFGQKLGKSENSRLEYKNYEWPFVSNNNLRLQYSLLKTICSFLNRSGGTILIGIDDQMTIKGLKINSIDEVKKYFDILKRQLFPPPEGLIQTVEIPIKEMVFNSEEKYRWIESRYVIRVEVQQGQLDRLYTFNHNNTIYTASREDASIQISDNIEDILQKTYHKAIHPQLRAQAIDYEIPDIEGLSYSIQIRENLVKQELLKQQKRFIAFTNIFKSKMENFKRFVEIKLEENYIFNFEIQIRTEHLIIITGENIDEIQEALEEIVSKNYKEIATYTYKSKPLSFGFLKNFLTIKPKDGPQIPKIVQLIKNYGYEYSFKESGSFFVKVCQSVDKLPGFYCACKVHKMNILIQFE